MPAGTRAAAAWLAAGQSGDGSPQSKARELIESGAKLQGAGILPAAMGRIGITEGAIPFAAAGPLRVIPCQVLGSATAAVIAMLGGVGDHAPHGGPIVLPVVDNRLMYVVAMVAGSLVTPLALNFIKSWSQQKTARSV